MRLFIGIAPPKDIKNYLFKIQNNLKDNTLVKMRLEGKTQLHLTLKFLGEIPEEDIGLIKKELREIKYFPFKINLSNIGTFASGGTLTVLWIGLKPKGEIIELQKQIDQATLKYGSIKLENPHITIGRIKSVKNKKKFLDKINNFKTEDLNFIVDEFCLYKSKLTKDGARY